MKILVNGGLTPYQFLLERYPHYLKYLGWLQTPRSGMSYNAIASFPFRLPIMADNSAFLGLDTAMYERFIKRIPSPSPLQWLTAPDVVGDAHATLNLFNRWFPCIIHLNIAFVGQDGAEDMELPWDSFCCLFIGGSTDWKLSTAAADVAREAKRRGKWLHMGRVNSDKRLRYAYDLGCDSIDGTGYSRFSKKHLKPALDFLHRLHTQLTLF